MCKIKQVIGKLSIQTIPENALLDGVVRMLREREAFNDADPHNNERMYHGDIFEQLAGEIAEKVESGLFIPQQKVIDQIDELAEYITADYVLITL